MQSEMKRIGARDWSKALAVAMTILSAALRAMGFAQMAQLDAANARINAVVQKAFYETCELTESMSVNLRKLLVVGDGAQAQQLLGEITRQAQGASGNLAMLPMGEETISATLKFINQVGDFSDTLSVRLAAGGAITDSDYETISVLSENAAAFSVGMLRLLERVEKGEVALDSAPVAGDESLYPLTNPAAEYPALLYDGPFSDGAEGDTFRALEGLEPVTAEQARQTLSAFLGGVSEIQLTGEGNVPVDCYEFALTANGYSLSAGVTRTGGKVLYVLSNADVTEVNYTPEQLLDTAQAFLLARGFGSMEMSYYSRFDGILTVNYAAVQNDVVLYPDLIKVQLSMKDGSVIGVEAGNYLMNHTQRTLELPAISEEDAVARIGTQLTPLAARLCVIPVDAGEALCYEIRATDGTDTFLVYIDAMTGTERELMQVVNDENGALVM